jgi:hypothetical protein
MKKGSAKSTPFTSPKKDSSQFQGADNNQKGNSSKNKKKSNKENWQVMILFIFIFLFLFSKMALTIGL